MSSFKSLRIVVYIILGTMSVFGSEFSPKVDSLIRVLDATIEMRPQYIAQKRHDIDMQRNQLYATVDPKQRFDILEKIFREYNSYSVDSAMMAAMLARNVAAQVGDEQLEWRAMLLEAEGNKGLAKYMIALNILDSIPARAHETLHEKIVERYSSVYYSLAENTVPESEARRYRDSLLHYRQVLKDLASTPEGKVINEIEYYNAKGEYQAAIDTYHAFVDGNTGIDAALQALLQYIVSEAYMQTGQWQVALEYLLEASINDLRRCDRKYNALPAVARIMYEQGDIQHAYDYIMCSLADIKASNAYSRMTRVLDAMPIISSAYDTHQRMMKRKERILQWVLVGSCLLAIVLGTIIYFDNKRLSRQRSRLRDRNSALISEKASTDAANASLMNSARAKDDYIGELFSLCSDYINIISAEHKALMKIVKSGKMADIERVLLKMQAPGRLGNFYQRFDKVFLDIFPDFIDKFNNMLQPEYRISVPDGQLTPELRIFALMRLGITDTAKIAAFLNYSPQTVYNYRFKTRSHALEGKDDFFEKVREL